MYEFKYVNVSNQQTTNKYVWLLLYKQKQKKKKIQKQTTKNIL